MKVIEKGMNTMGSILRHATEIKLSRTIECKQKRQFLKV
jgi:hypothetical protein